MRIFVAPALIALVLPLVLRAQPAPPSTPAALPNVTAYALDKAKLTLPADFSAPLNLLILSFARDQQDAVESWLPIAAEMRSAHPKVQSWTLPVSARQGGLYKWWLNSSIRSSLPSDERQHYTVPLYVDKAQFLKSLSISSQKQIVVLVTDKAGLVLWRSEGATTEEKKASLTAFLKTSPLAR